MTTLKKHKEEKYSEIESLANEIINTRLRVVEASQLADEIKAETDQGLLNPYPEMALFYGNQRAILRGLTSADVIYFDLPTISQWNDPTQFTLPSKTQFGYQFVDMDENDSRIDDPELYYLTRKKEDKTLSTIENDSGAFSYPTVLDNHPQQKIAIDDETDQYEITLTFPATLGTLKVYYDGLEIGHDSGNGKILGDMFRTATIAYDEKVILVFGAPPKKGTKIKVTYDTYTGVDQFNESYEQVNFTLSQKVDFDQALDLINIGQGVISKEPELLNTMYLRRKSDHQPVGIVQVICEGLIANSKWDPLAGNPEDYLKITHDQFKTFLGYINPDISNDLTKSANPEIVSSGRKVGSTYPDIEASPFFPWTDGTYLGSQPYTGNYVHLEEGTPKWSVHPDIKWQYGTAPASLGETDQENPDTTLSSLNTIEGFSGAGNNPIPADTGDSTQAGKSYEMVGDYVHEFDWYDAGAAPPYTKDAGVEYTCYYNDVQHYVEDNQSSLDFLIASVDKIEALGDTANTIDTDRQTDDSDFITQSTAFKTIINSFLAYHNSFDPITARPTYDTSVMTTFQSAITLYISIFNARVTDLDGVIGTATTSGYSKIIYDSSTMATHMEIGYLRGVIDELNTIQSLYTAITNAQGQYALLP